MHSTGDKRLLASFIASLADTATNEALRLGKGLTAPGPSLPEQQEVSERARGTAGSVSRELLAVVDFENSSDRPLEWASWPPRLWIM